MLSSAGNNLGAVFNTFNSTSIYQDDTLNIDKLNPNFNPFQSNEIFHSYLMDQCISILRIFGGILNLNSNLDTTI